MGGNLVTLGEGSVYGSKWSGSLGSSGFMGWIDIKYFQISVICDLLSRLA